MKEIIKNNSNHIRNDLFKHPFLCNTFVLYTIQSANQRDIIVKTQILFKRKQKIFRKVICFIALVYCVHFLLKRKKMTNQKWRRKWKQKQKNITKKTDINFWFLSYLTHSLYGAESSASHKLSRI